MNVLHWCPFVYLFHYVTIFTIADLHITIPLVITNLRDSGYSFYQSGVSLKNYSP